MFHIVYRRQHGMLVTRKPHTHWREIQDEFDDYMASLGPWSDEEIIEFIRIDFPKDPPFTEEELREFFSSSEELLVESSR